MRFEEIKPFVRHTHKIRLGDSLDKTMGRFVTAFDNRLFFCEDGEGVIICRGESHKMSRGDVAIIPPGETYMLVTPSESVTYICVNFDYSYANSRTKIPIPPQSAEDFDSDMIVERSFFGEDEELNSPVFLYKVQRIENKLNKMQYIYQKKVIYYELELSGILSGVLLECLRCVKLTGLRSSDSVFDKITEYIYENYGRRLTNSDIAEKFGYNPNYVSDLIKLTTGLSLHKYLLNVRIERAIELLEWSGCSVGEIAEKCGFYDIYHFSKVFKAATGTSPAKYRK